MYMNIDVSEAAISQIVRVIRFGTSNLFLNHVPPFRYLGCVLQCAVFPHTSVHHTLRSRLLSLRFSQSIYHQIAFETWSQNDVIFSSREAKKRKNVPPAGRLQRDPPGAPPAGPSHQLGGGQRARFRRGDQCTGRVQCTGISASTYCTG